MLRNGGGGMKKTRRVAILALLSAAAVAASPASASDSLGSPAPLAFGTSQVEDTSSYGVEAGEPNTGAPFDNLCDVGRRVRIARTAWFSVAGTGEQVTVSTAGSSFDTAMFVYSGSPAGAMVTCSDDGPDTGISASASFNTSPGVGYLIQAGSFCNDLDSSHMCKLPLGPPDGGTLKVLASVPAAGPTGKGPTGKRAAALKKCKKKTKKGTKARKKCRKRAKKLPLEVQR
jgi:hypothetical protein